jgi:hypothetical protein
MVAQDVNWVAGGVKFTTFAFIHGTIIVAVQFGQEFAIEVLGAASFGIDPLAYFEIDLEATADADKFILVARVSPNSYLIHPDIFHLQGDFALGIWYHPDADFVLSIGGFHPAFQWPRRYTDAFHSLARVEVDAVVYGFVHLSVQCFFACTSQALMAGASVSLSASFAGIGVGLDVYVDVLMTWEPFYILADLGVIVWFEFFGRHEIGVELSVWTPPFGGHAHISLAVVSFDVDFGSEKSPADHPTLDQFVTAHLGAPAASYKDLGASLPRFNTKDQAGLLRLDVTGGRSRVETPPAGPSPQDKQQEGLSAGDAIGVCPEFTFNVHSRLPIDNAPDTVTQTVTGTLSIPLCTRLPTTLHPSLKLTATRQSDKKQVALQNDPSDPAHPRLQLLQHSYPKAQFGELPVSARAQAGNPDARGQIASIDTESSTKVLTSGLAVDWSAAVPSDQLVKLAAGAAKDESDPGTQVYPLPLDLVPGRSVTAHIPSARVRLGPVPLVAWQTRQSIGPVKIKFKSASAAATVPQLGSFVREPVITRLRGMGLAQVPAGVAVIAPPPSPPRSADLFAVSLKVLPAHAPAPVGRAVAVEPPPASAVPNQPNAATLAPGSAVHLQIDANTASSSQVATSGNQVVRVIVLNERDVPLADRYVPAAQAVGLPDQARRIIAIGEGANAPVAATALESIGIERDTALLVLGDGAYAAHGCVVTCNAPLRSAPGLLATVPGRLILEGSSSLSILFPALPAGWSLAVVTSARVAQPDTVTDQVRWLAVDAALGPLQTVVAPGRLALLMPVTATGPWTLHAEVGPQWQFLGIAVSDLSVSDLIQDYQSAGDWDLVDDRFEQSDPGLSAGLTLEAAAS